MSSFDRRESEAEYDETWNELHVAVVQDDIDEVQRILQHDRSLVNIPTQVSPTSPLLCPLSSLLLFGKRPSLTVALCFLQSGNTPLHLAVLNNTIETINLLLKAGAQTNARNNEGETPLHYAVEVGEMRAILHLTRSGADLQPRDRRGRTPMDWAVDAESEVVIRFLVALGAPAPVFERREMDHRGQTLIPSCTESD